ncbi:MAG: transcription elongation factor GreA [Patescibacteria group bacterium]
MSYITQQKLDELKERLEYLKTEKRREISKKIGDAKAMGDISENAELDVANDERGFNEQEILKLEQTIKTAQIMDEGAKHTKIEVGATIEIEMDGEHAAYHIVGIDDADLEQNKISNVSPLGRELMGHKVGDEFEIKLPAGSFPTKIISIK